jgi:predicted DNA-binding ribbon-helix-helix protein
MKMHATQIYLSQRQYKVLQEVSKEKCVTMSEIIRRILDEWIDNDDKIIQNGT